MKNLKKSCFVLLILLSSFYFMKNDCAADVETLRPNAAGSLTEFETQGPSSGAHWEKVDEAAPDELTTYVVTSYNNPTYKIDLYNLPNHTGSGTIDSVTVYFRHWSNVEGGQNGMMAALRTNGANYFGNEVYSPYDSFLTSSYTWTTNPNTGSPWTWSEIDALEIGARASAQWEGGQYLTQVYAEVNSSYPPPESPHAFFGFVKIIGNMLFK